MTGFTYINYVKNTEVFIKPESKLIIKGKTNINTFNCNYSIINLENPIPVNFEFKGNKVVFNKTNLILNNDCFDCGNKTINKDFKILLKTNEYPQIFLRLKEMENYNFENSTSNVLVEMEIAGIIKSYKVPVNINNNENNLFVKGKLEINICDFNLDPPKKFLGLITVNNMIEIDFQLLLQEKIN